MPWEGRGTGVIAPEACATVCLAVLEVFPDKVECTRRGTSCQVAGGLKSEPAAATLRPHRTTAKPRKQGRKPYPHPPAEYVPCDSSKCRSRWWRPDQPIWTVSVGIRH